MPAVSARCLANRVISSSIWDRHSAGAEQIYYSNGSEHDHTGEGTCPTHYDRSRTLQCVVAGSGSAANAGSYMTPRWRERDSNSQSPLFLSSPSRPSGPNLALSIEASEPIPAFQKGVG